MITEEGESYGDISLENQVETQITCVHDMASFNRT
jgi:hypothetical protein